MQYNNRSQPPKQGGQDSFAIVAHFWQNAPARERQSRCLH
jgi:hypothetical protein